MEQVSNFISNRENELFSGVWMLVAQWIDIPLFGNQVKRYVHTYVQRGLQYVSELCVLVCGELWMLIIKTLYCVLY